MIQKKSRRELVREAQRGREIAHDAAVAAAMTRTMLRTLSAILVAHNGALTVEREYLDSVPADPRVEAQPDQDGNVTLRLLPPVAAQ